LCVLSTTLCLSGCSSLDNLLTGDKIDYRSQGTKTSGLDVPPDLTQLTRDSRYQQSQSGSVSAAAFQASAPAGTPVASIAAAASSPGGSSVAAQAIGDLRLERLGNERWLHTDMPAEQLWPQLRAFWKERGLELIKDEPNVGVMETDWSENHAKLPLDIIRRTLGSALDTLYSTGELDKYRTRVERDGPGSDVYITHRGMVEVYDNARKDETRWQPRPSDPELEGELLSRLMLKLGATTEAAKAAVEDTKPAAPGVVVATRARLTGGAAANTLQVDDNFDRAWRRVGVALDRSGFTVEDRDRTQGVYYVRYVDPKYAGKEEPSLIARIFSFGKRDDSQGPARYRVTVKGDGDHSLVSVLNGQGGLDTGDNAKRIAAALLDELK
jgi:outer membrane protein assembly factor BamC